MKGLFFGKRIKGEEEDVNYSEYRDVLTKRQATLLAEEHMQDGIYIIDPTNANVEVMADLAQYVWVEVINGVKYHCFKDNALRDILVDIETGSVSYRDVYGNIKRYMFGNDSKKDNGYLYATIYYYRWKKEQGLEYYDMTSSQIGQHTIVALVALLNVYEEMSQDYEKNNKIYVNHMDGCPFHNSIHNLELVNNSDNVIHGKVKNLLCDTFDDCWHYEYNAKGKEFKTLNCPMSICDIKNCLHFYDIDIDKIVYDEDFAHKVRQVLINTYGESKWGYR